MADYPDVYADGLGITGSTYGLTLTFTLTQPTGEPGPREEATQPVARVRIGRELGKALHDMLAQALAAQLPNPQASSTTKN